MKLKLQTTKLTPYLIATVVILLVCFYSRAPRWMPGVDTLDRLELMSFDWRVREAIQRSPNIATNLGYVEITDASIAYVASGALDEKKFGLYWPRQIYGRAVRELGTQGAAAVAFDVVFGEERPDHPKVELPGGKSIESDEFFARQIRTNGHVILATANGLIPPPIFKDYAWKIGHIEAPKDDDGVLRRAQPFEDVIDWSENVRIFARENGIELKDAVIEPRRIKFKLSDGGVFILHTDTQHRFDVDEVSGTKRAADKPREVQKAFVERRIWNLGILLAARELKLDLDHPEFDWANNQLILLGPGGVERRIPLDDEGNFHIDWSSSVGSHKLTRDEFHQLLINDGERQAGKASGITNKWAGKLVLIGSTATGNDLTDRGATPLKKETPLMSKHWNVANMFLTDRFIRRTSYPGGLALLAGLGIFSVVVTWKLRAPWGTIVILAVAGAFVFAALQLYVQQRYWVPIVLPVLGALVLNHAALVTYQVIFEQKEKRRVKAVFSKLVSPNVVNELLSTETLNLGGARRNITVLFADVRGFTTLTDTNQANAEAYVKEHKLTGADAEAYFDEQARETLDTVNVYLATIADRIKEHDGTLDKYIGDCVMAFWGAPVANERHAVACVRCAVAAQRAMYELNERRNEENKRREEENKQRTAAGQPPRSLLARLSLGTGINSGVSIVGLMGSVQHTFNYTVFGREVNLASRLEGVSGRGRIIIGETTYNDLVRFDAELAKTCVELDPVHVKGIEKAVRIFEVPWKTPEALAAEAAAKAAQTSAGAAAPAVAKS